MRALLVKSPWEDMMLLARYAQDKTRGAAALDYCQGLSWNLPLLFGLQRLCRNWGRCCLLPKLCLDGSCPHLGREEGAGGLRGYEVNRKITHLNDAFHCVGMVGATSHHQPLHGHHLGCFLLWMTQKLHVETSHVEPKDPDVLIETAQPSP